ncbi:unnamed protein product [marine sediment metagenome]|uniref:Uncharacterized protein n=1 Tax=marine sediment metagenome TaxID=412755 RepID=X1FR25_9ZZZZ
MNIDTSLNMRSLVGGVLLVIIVVMGNAYWVEAVRWADKADAAKSCGNAQREATCVEMMLRAKYIFQGTSILLLAALVGTVLPILAPNCTVQDSD